jgi:hypothetical protein
MITIKPEPTTKVHRLQDSNRETHCKRLALRRSVRLPSPGVSQDAGPRSHHRALSRCDRESGHLDDGTRRRYRFHLRCGDGRGRGRDQYPRLSSWAHGPDSDRHLAARSPDRTRDRRIRGFIRHFAGVVPAQEAHAHIRACLRPGPVPGVRMGKRRRHSLVRAARADGDAVGHDDLGPAPGLEPARLRARRTVDEPRRHTGVRAPRRDRPADPADQRGGVAGTDRDAWSIHGGRRHRRVDHHCDRKRHRHGRAAWRGHVAGPCHGAHGDRRGGPAHIDRNEHALVFRCGAIAQRQHGRGGLVRACLLDGDQPAQEDWCGPRDTEYWALFLIARVPFRRPAGWLALRFLSDPLTYRASLMFQYPLAFVFTNIGALAFIVAFLIFGRRSEKMLLGHYPEPSENTEGPRHCNIVR